MTEHSKIPLPPEVGAQRPGSLFERASGVFGLEGFRSAPMPIQLAEPAHRRSVSAKPDVPQRATVEARHERPETAPPFAEAPQATEPPMPQAEPALRFGGTRHEIVREALRTRGMIVPEDGATALLEEFRIVKRQILASAQAAGDDAARRVLVCSPHPGEGKTFCAVNLAIAMAGERGGEVLLVDADFAKPSVLSTLGLPTAAGLMDVLADPELRIEDLILATDIPGLFVLPAGNQTNADSEWLASSRTSAILDRLTRGAPQRMVVFDSPPALAASPAAELAQHVGQAILVARADMTGRSALEDAVQLLGACPDIKLLLNAAHFSPSGRRFGSYYGSEGVIS